MRRGFTEGRENLTTDGLRTRGFYLGSMDEYPPPFYPLFYSKAVSKDFLSIEPDPFLLSQM